MPIKYVIKFGFQKMKLSKEFDMWLFGITLQHYREETYLEFRFFRWGFRIGRLKFYR